MLRQSLNFLKTVMLKEGNVQDQQYMLKLGANEKKKNKHYKKTRILIQHICLIWLHATQMMV